MNPLSEKSNSNHLMLSMVFFQWAFTPTVNSSNRKIIEEAQRLYKKEVLSEVVNNIWKIKRRNLTIYFLIIFITIFSYCSLKFEDSNSLIQIGYLLSFLSLLFIDVTERFKNVNFFRESNINTLLNQHRISEITFKNDVQDETNEPIEIVIEENEMLIEEKLDSKINTKSEEVLDISLCQNDFTIMKQVELKHTAKVCLLIEYVRWNVNKEYFLDFSLVKENRLQFIKTLQTKWNYSNSTFNQLLKISKGSKDGQYTFLELKGKYQETLNIDIEGIYNFFNLTQEKEELNFWVNLAIKLNPKIKYLLIK